MPASAGTFEIPPQKFERPTPQQGREYSRLRALVELPDHGDEAVKVARDLMKTILDQPRPSAHLTDQLSDAVVIDALTMFLVERGVALADGDEEPFLRTKRVKHGGRQKGSA
jgi:hypothetical protein